MSCRVFKDKAFRCFIRNFNRILLFVSIFLFGSLAVVLFDAVFSSKYCLCLTMEGVRNMQSFWMDYEGLIKAFCGCFTIWVISYNLTKYIDMETIKAVGDLRAKLDDVRKKELHSFLLHDDDKKPIMKMPDRQGKEETAVQGNPNINPNVELFDYLGTIELGAIMVKRGAVTLEEFYNQFGYRVENIVRNDDIKRHIDQYPGSYKYLHYIISELKKADMPDIKLAHLS